MSNFNRPQNNRSDSYGSTPTIAKGTPLNEGMLSRNLIESDIENLEKWGKFFAPENPSDKTALSTTQIRKFFGEMKKIQSNFDKEKNQIILLDPKMAYAVGRSERGNKIKDFYEQLSPLLRKIGEEKPKLDRFVSIVEAIVAYHKANGGK
jgi:CRISPR type III-A-associated protein Csm2